MPRDDTAMQPDSVSEAPDSIQLDHAREASARVDDLNFIHDLKRLKDLRSFLIQEAVRADHGSADALSFGKLNLLKYSPNGRPPTEDEWTDIERHTQVLFGMLTEPLRRRFVLGGISWTVAWLPIILVLIAAASLILAILSYKQDLLHMGSPGANVMPFYLVWMMSLGAIGAVAFIGMNALSVQEDITFDLTNKRLMVLRIVLGALFGLVLTLPFGFNDFQLFCQSILFGDVPAASKPNISVSSQAIMLVLPFILGFSTTLVILVLNQVVQAVQVFFGRGNGSNSRVAPSTGAPTPT